MNEKLETDNGTFWVRRQIKKAMKRYKARLERRRARKNPECVPEYNRYHGYYW